MWQGGAKRRGVAVCGHAANLVLATYLSFVLKSLWSLKQKLVLSTLLSATVNVATPPLPSPLYHPLPQPFVCVSICVPSHCLLAQFDCTCFAHVVANLFVMLTDGSPKQIRLQARAQCLQIVCGRAEPEIRDTSKTIMPEIDLPYSISTFISISISDSTFVGQLWAAVCAGLGERYHGVHLPGQRSPHTRGHCGSAGAR